MRHVRFLLLGLLVVLAAMLPLHDAHTEYVTEDWIATRAESGMAGGATDSAGNTYVLIVRTIHKYDSAGTELWSRTFDPCGGPCASQSSRAIAVSPTDHYVWATGKYGDSSDTDWVTVQYEADGTFRWMKSYGGSLHDSPRALVADEFDNIHITGVVHNGSNRDAATIKYDVDGNLLWAKTYNNGSHDDGNDIGIDSSGRVYMLAMSIDNAEDFLLIVYSSGGSQLCSHRYDYGNPGPNNVNDIPEDMAVEPGGGAFVTGRSVASSFDFATIKYTSSCGVSWIRRWDTGFDDDARQTAVDGSGGVYVSGDSGQSNTPPSAKGMITLRYDAGGTLLWSDRYDGSGNLNDKPSDIAVDASGAYVIGYSPGDGTGTDWVTVAYSPTGYRRWIKRHTSSGAEDDVPKTVTLDAAGGVYVAGTQVVAGEPSALIRYAEDTDGDTVPDYRDNCPNTINPNQEDNVHPNGIGDHCDDPEPDLVFDITDNCPDDYNPGQEDGDGDEVGDACDNCPATPNPGQENADGDQWGDACENCPDIATPWLVPPGDVDCDGWSSGDEGVIGTDPADPCANTGIQWRSDGIDNDGDTKIDEPDEGDNDEADDRWPPDFDDNQVINVLDLGEVLPPYFGTSVPPTSPRRDLVPDGFINVLDVGMTLPPFFGYVCT